MSWAVHPIDGGFRFAPPTARRRLVPRPRLLALLRARFSRRVVAVVAPAGFGKTTLLAQAVAEADATRDRIDLWLSCTSDDEAASSLTDGLCRAAGVDPQPSPEAAVDAVAAALWHRAPAQVAIVLDDVHLVAPGSSGAAALARLVAALPRNGHVVLAGRTPPPVPLARLDVQGEVVRVGEADLSFSPDELADFARQRGVPLDQVAACGGWPALAELSASGAPGTDAEYLWEEVLGRLTEDQRRDLALVAHAEITDPDVAAAVLGHDVDLDALTRELPLAKVGGEGGRLVHPLWLPHLAAVVAPGELADARRRAGLAVAERGDLWAAVGHLAKAEAWEDMARVVVEALGVTSPPVPGDVAATWLRRLPPDVADGALALLLEAVARGPDDPEGAMRLLEEAAAGFRRAGDGAGELAAIAQLAQLAWWRSDVEPLADIAVRFLEMEAQGDEKAVPLACLARALVADLTNRPDDVLAELDRIPERSLNDTWIGLERWMRAAALSQLGRPHEAVRLAEESMKTVGPLYEPLVEATRYGALWMTGAVDDCLAGMPELVERSAAGGVSEYTAVVCATYAQLAAAADRVHDAERYLRRARDLAAVPRSPLVDVGLVQAEAALRVAVGDEDGARDVLEDYRTRATIGAGIGAAPQQRALALWYVLVPDTRPYWDGADLGPYFTDARTLARAVVARRRGDDGPRRAAAAVAPGVVRAFLPAPWATELALAHVAAGDDAGWALLEALWPRAQAHVRRVAGEGDLARPARAALARLPVPPDGRLELRLLGPVELRRDGVPVDAPQWRRRRVRDLLAHLALRPHDSREQVAADLWPDLDGEGQARNLRVTLTHLLRALEPGRRNGDASFLVQARGDGLALHRGEWFEADVWRFDELAEAALEADRRGEPSTALARMLDALDLWRGEPTEVAAADWAIAEVEARRARVAGLAERAGVLLLAQGHAERAARLGELALAVDPWADGAHELVVRAHAATGRRRAARAAATAYGDALRELGLGDDEIRRRLRRVERAIVPRAS